MHLCPLSLALNRTPRWLLCAAVKEIVNLYA
jgi:hypothetical protein